MRDREFLLGPPAGETTLDVLKRNAVKRDELLERLADDPNRPRLLQAETYDWRRPIYTRRWIWRVENTTTGEVLATGRAWTKKAAIRRKHRAYRKALAALHAEREQEATS